MADASQHAIETSFPAHGKILTVIGLMSGTSLDGVDAAILHTDGRSYLAWPANGFVSRAYSDARRNAIRGVFGGSNAAPGVIDKVAHDLTVDHVTAIEALLAQTGLKASDIDLIGFHGQTISHAPERGHTCQIGAPELLARTFGIPVVSDFRSADVAAGGQGAPLIPLYHEALIRMAGVQTPVAVLNLGGVGNITYVGEAENDLLAFDTGPGNALIDDAVLATTAKRFDEDGRLAASGHIDDAMVATWMNHPYFHLPAPKSLDRNAFRTDIAHALSAADRVATITDFTVQSVLTACKLMPTPIHALYVCGGGRHNHTIMQGLQKGLGVPVLPVETLNWQGDALEAQGFAYLAVRSRQRLPLSLPTTTGVKEPLTGGVLTIPPGTSMMVEDSGV